MFRVKQHFRTFSNHVAYIKIADDQFLFHATLFTTGEDETPSASYS